MLREEKIEESFFRRRKNLEKGGKSCDVQTFPLFFTGTSKKILNHGCGLQLIGPYPSTLKLELWISLLSSLPSDNFPHESHEHSNKACFEAFSNNHY